MTREAGLLDPVNSNAACWGDYDKDGWIDLFIGCERQPNRLYRNRGNGTFEEVSAKAGLRAPEESRFCKGTTWVDVDNDDYPDLFLNNVEEPGELYRNNRDGTFANVTSEMGIDAPVPGFSCWTWDYDNDGWLDIFATSLDRNLAAVVNDMLGQPHDGQFNRLYRNVEGKRFEDKTREAGLDMAFAPMGSNFADFDNDGYLDMYLATGAPSPAWSRTACSRMWAAVASRRSPAPAARATSRRVMRWRAATGTAMATSTSSSRPAVPSTATSFTTSELLCGRPHKSSYVFALVMWCPATALLGFRLLAKGDAT